ncbi:MAG: phage minor capsid protein, partial [Lachnospiraceae bacterium]|nr:phage minor capsid protein [Lachnospiraceae bacterium]
MRIMEDIVRRIKVNGFSTASADWQITRLQQLGESEEDIKKWIQEALAVSDAEIERIFSDEVYKQYMGH